MAAFVVPKSASKEVEGPSTLVAADVLPNDYSSPPESQADFVCQVGEDPHWLEVHVGLRCLRGPAPDPSSAG